VNTSQRNPNRPRGGFQPPHCPNPQCDFHHPNPRWPFKRDGFYIRPSDQARFQAFKCLHCGRKFSTRTFSSTYWLQRRRLLLDVAKWTCEGPCLRQMGRVLKASHSTIARRIARLGRLCLVFHRNLLQNKKLEEPVVVDGFETFEYSQYFPFHINFAAGADSWFLYHFTDSPLRRKGSMTKGQKKRRAELEETLGRPDPKAVEKGMVQLLKTLLGHLEPGERLVLHSDDHPAYHRALQRLEHTAPQLSRIEHHVTSSQEPRTKDNPLFPINLTDLLARHSSANHRRETIAYSKRRQSALERAAIFTVWRNCIKKRTENGGEESTAMRAGLVARMLSWGDVLRHRLFPAHGDLPPVWTDYYWRKVKTLALGERQSAHTCRYAF
jgi:transposase-like protein